MLFDKINITKELIKAREHALPDEIAKTMLAKAAKNDLSLIQRIKDNNGNDDLPEISNADPESIFSINEIEKICINYRLRFLDIKHFRYDLPYEALMQIREFEKNYDTKISRLRIIAPYKAFELEDANQDPLLFAELSNGKYYLLHQWGNDLAWYRKYLYFPVRNIYSYFYFMLAVAAIFAFSIPFEWFRVNTETIMYMRMWLTIHCFIGLFFMVIFLGAIMQTGFSSMIWKSKFMNE